MAKEPYSFNFASPRLKNGAEERGYAHEFAMLAATGALVSAMEEEGISQAELARRLGKGPAFVSQVLSGSRNMTLRTLSDFAWALGRQIREFQLVTFGEMRVPYQNVDTWLDSEPVITEVQTTEGSAFSGSGQAVIDANASLAA